MNEEGVLNNPFRKLLYQYIMEHPGSSFKLMLTVFRVPPGTLRYHLSKLERTNRINIEKNGKKLRYYSSFHRSPDLQAPRTEISKKESLLLQLIREDPGIRTNSLALRSGMKRKELYYHLRKLRESRSVWKTEGGGYEILSREDLRRELSLLLIDRFLEGKIDRSKFDSLMKKLNDL
jgi:predicted transcriptional regulator